MPRVIVHPAGAAARGCGPDSAGALPLTATSLTGYSGGGRKMIEPYEAGGDPRLLSPRPYTPSGSRTNVSRDGRAHGPGRRPCSCPSSVTSTGGWRSRSRWPPDAREPARRRGGRSFIPGGHYASERFVRVMPFTTSMEHRGRSLRYRGLQQHEPGGSLRLRERRPDRAPTVRIDNLGKGASGAAIQCLNITLGLDEGLGL